MDEKKDNTTQENTTVATYSGKGRPPRAIAEKVKEENKKKKLAIKKNKEGAIVTQPKMELFLEEFLKNGGNATQAALVVFNCSSVESAAVVGHVYLKKAKGLARVIMEKKGYGYGKMLDVALQKMEEGKTPEWWDRLMKLAEYEDFMTKKESSAPAVVNVFQTQKELQDQFGFAEEAEVVSNDEDEEE